MSSTEIETPPHDDDAERALLGAALMDIAALDVAVDRLDPGDLYRERHRHIYEAMRELHHEGVDDLDVLALADRLKSAGYLEAIGGKGYLVGLANEVPSAANAEQYVELLERHALHREALSTLGTHYDRLRHDTDDVREAVDEATAELHDVTAEQSSDTMSTASELAKDGVRAMEEAHEGRGDSCTPTGLLDLDEHLDGGWYDGAVYVLAGRPGMGKTALACETQSRHSVTADDPAKTLFASLEMPDTEVTLRHFAILADASFRDIRKGEATEQQWARLMRRAGEFAEAPLCVDDEPSINPHQLRAKARRAKAEMGGLDIVYVDYLQRMKPPPGNYGRHEQELAAISEELKSLAKDLDSPVVVLAQLNRGVEDRENKRPELRDLRGSGAIEENADLAAFLYRESYYDEESDDRTAELLIHKNRHGPEGKIRLAWRPTVPSFGDLDDWHERGGGA